MDSDDPEGRAAHVLLVRRRRQARQRLGDAHGDAHGRRALHLPRGHRRGQPLRPSVDPHHDLHLDHLRPLHTMNPSRLRLEHGYAVVTALVLTTLMLTIGLAAFAFVDTEQSASGRERERESRLNLTEGVALFADLRALSELAGVGSRAPTRPAARETSTDPKCPDAGQLESHFSAVDFKLGPTWTVQVVDNPGAPGRFYSDTLLTTPGVARWDQSGPQGVPDGEMWVRAEGRIDGRKRVVVARVRAEKEQLPLPAELRVRRRLVRDRQLRQQGHRHGRRHRPLPERAQRRRIRPRTRTTTARDSTRAGRSVP